MRSWLDWIEQSGATRKVRQACHSGDSAVERTVRKQDFQQSRLLNRILPDEQIVGVFSEFENLRPRTE
jgi:hypothetical protein